MTVSIIGSGNIAWHLTSIFEENGVRVAEVFARKRRNAENIIGYLYNVEIKTDLDFSNSPSDIFILAISDDAIAAVAAEILLPENAILVHTSGAKKMSVLTVALTRNPDVSLGVFYPLMTFTKGIKIDFSEIPFCLESEDELTYELLESLTAQISNNVNRVSSHQRNVLHVAAVFGCNFVNHLWALSKEVLEEEKLDFELIKPLLRETFAKAMKANHPAEVQTGPAIRRDLTSINKHKKLIGEDEDLLNVYQVLTKSIQDWHE